MERQLNFVLDHFVIHLKFLGSKVSQVYDYMSAEDRKVWDNYWSGRGVYTG